MTGGDRAFRGALLLLAAAAGLAAAVGVSAHTGARFYRGDIAAPTSWDGIIRLTGTIVIREGVTVTVDPGTEVLVQPGVGAAIVVRGRLFVRGSPAKPVVFDSAGGCGKGPWEGIVFGPGSTGILEHAAVRCSVKGIAGDLSGVRRADVAVDPPRP